MLQRKQKITFALTNNNNKKGKVKKVETSTKNSTSHNLPQNV